MGLANANSPMSWDFNMLGSAKVYAENNQIMLITPFILGGAMAPVTVAAQATQTLAEALAGMAFCQIVRPGAPVIFGSFASSMSMQSGAPTFGTPEPQLVLFVLAALARRLGVPFRSGGNFTASKLPDYQAAYESAISYLATMQAGVNFNLHTAGWLEGGLAIGYEKFILDEDQASMTEAYINGVDITDNGYALDAMLAGGPGQHFLGSPHTLANFENAFWRSELSNNDSFEQWEIDGGLDAAQRANVRWKRAWPSTRCRRSTRRSTTSSSTGWTGARRASRIPTSGPEPSCPMTAGDPLLQPFQLRHLTLRNRIMSTAHEPAYAEDGKPKLRYQLYQEEKAKGGIALTMFGGSTNVAADSPPVFGQLYAGDDDIIPWFQQLADRMHAHGAATMIQLTHLGRRTVWDDGDWLPTISPSSVREPAHRSFPKEMEDSDIRRVVGRYAEAARRCKEGGLDGLELEAYGHLSTSSGRRSSTSARDDYGGIARQPDALLDRGAGGDQARGRRRLHRRHPDDRRRGRPGRADRGRRHRDRADAGPDRDDRLHQHHQGLDRHRRGDLPRDPGLGTPLGAGTRVRRAVPRARRPAGLPCQPDRRRRDRPPRDRRGHGRHGRHDPRAHGRPAHRPQARSGRGGPDPALRRGVDCINRIYLGLDALCIHNPATGREETMPHVIARGRPGRGGGSSSSAPARPGWRRRASPPSAATRSCCSRPPPSPAGRSCSRPGRRARRATSSGSSTGSRRECRHAGRRPAVRTSSPTPRTVAGARARRRHRRDRRPAALPPLTEGEDLVVSTLGRHQRGGHAVTRRGAGLRRPRHRGRAVVRRADGAGGLDGRDRDARPARRPAR